MVWISTLSVWSSFNHVRSLSHALTLSCVAARAPGNAEYPTPSFNTNSKVCDRYCLCEMCLSMYVVEGSQCWHLAQWSCRLGHNPRDRQVRRNRDFLDLAGFGKRCGTSVVRSGRRWQRSCCTAPQSCVRQGGDFLPGSVCGFCTSCHCPETSDSPYVPSRECALCTGSPRSSGTRISVQRPEA